MEQKTESEGVIDLSDALSEDPRPDIYEEPMPREENNRRIPALYRFIIKLSHGMIKNEKQAQAVAILIIIAANLVTFSLLYKENSRNIFEQEVPTEVENTAETAVK